jgi:predicted ATPase/class 3 adenylate cyclase
VVLPSGAVTFLFTDIEGSTRLWDERPEAMRVALARHDELLQRAIAEHGGYVFSTAGDGMAAAFQRSSDAVAAAVDAQLALGCEAWPDGAALRVRMGLHTGEAEERDGNYLGSPLNRAARLMAAANGGQIVVTDVTAGLIGETTGVGLVDLGVRRLRGLVEPTRVFGVKAQGLDWVDRPLATGEASRGNLPRPATEWFGPLASISRRAADLGRRRLVTLTGPGGVGKTRLAIEVAGLVTVDFPDGVWMLELGPLADPDAVLATTASTLGVLPQPGLDLLGAILDWLEGRRLLLVVDNCEHVLAAVVELVEAVVGRCPTVTVLATSREPLGVDGERVAPVPAMAQADAVELFCDRALAADDTVEFTDADRDTVAAICARLDGIPLAIELAAARARSLTPVDIFERLVDRFRVLRGGGRGVERHQTLHATVDWSYRLLSDVERLLFDRLSVFAGGFDLAAAEGVCGSGRIDPDDVVDLLAGLVDKSLVVADRHQRATRYRVLETLRQYGEERIAERGESALLQERHTAHFLCVARAAVALWATPRFGEGAGRLAQEWDNIRVAHAAALDLGDLGFAVALLDATGQYAVDDLRVEYVDWARRTVLRCEQEGRPEPAIYGYASTVEWAGGEFQRAVDLATKGISVAGHDDWPEVAVCWSALGLGYCFTGRIDQTLTIVPRLEAALSADDPRIGFHCSHTLVLIATLTDATGLDRYTERAGAVAARTGSPVLLAHAQWGEGLRWRCADPPDHTAALACHRRGLVVAREAGARLELALNLLAVAATSVQLALTDADEALADAITYAHELRAWSMAWTMIGYATTHLARTGRLYAAGVLSGYLTANQPFLVETLEVSAVTAGAALADIRGPEAEQGISVGAATERNELVNYALSVLSHSD